MTFAHILTVLQIIVLVLSLLSGIGQAVIVCSSHCYCCLLLSVFSLAVVSCTLNLMILGFSDYWSDLHFLVMGLSASSGSLQVIILGIMTRKKIVNSQMTTLTLSVIWFLQVYLIRFKVIMTYLCTYLYSLICCMLLTLTYLCECYVCIGELFYLTLERVPITEDSIVAPGRVVTDFINYYYYYYCIRLSRTELFNFL